jgi:hypothetical protein
MLTYAGTEVVELLQPPDAAAVGERIKCEGGADPQPDEVLKVLGYEAFSYECMRLQATSV